MSGRHLIVVGAGGNIGSHLVPHLGRLRGVDRVTLVDSGIYEAGNLRGQDLRSADVGRRKAVVQARRLRGIRPDLRVEAISEPVERMPLGRLRADLLLACLDSRRSRQYLNQAAWRLGVPWIDAGVDGGSLLARVTVYIPGASNPCLECAWDENDYQLLEQLYPCQQEAEEPFPTAAPSGLGALAASLQILECGRFLASAAGEDLPGKQIVVDANSHLLYLSHFRRNPSCRMKDHRPWRIRELKAGVGELTVHGASSLASSNGKPVWLRVDGKLFVRRLTCPGCGHSRKLLRLQSASTPEIRRCPDCGRAMVAGGFDTQERLEVSTLSATEKKRGLHRLGFREGEMFTVGNGECMDHFEITGRGPEAARRREIQMEDIQR